MRYLQDESYWSTVLRRLCYTGSRIYIPGIGNERRSVVPKRVVLRSRGEDSLSEYGQGVRVYGSSKDLCTSLVLRLRGSGLRVFGATENTGRTGWDCKLLSGLTNEYVKYEVSVELTLL